MKTRKITYRQYLSLILGQKQRQRPAKHWPSAKVAGKQTSPQTAAQSA
jgi:hypothetical protein